MLKIFSDKGRCFIFTKDKNVIRPQDCQKPLFTMSQVRVRFAPSPTGSFHIGSARTALFNWLYARHTGGAFVLRIEDTDRERNTPEALRVLLNGMRWLGLNWDEGPEVGGSFGPYFQSERETIYQEYLAQLRDRGCVYDKDNAVWFRISGEAQVIEDAVRGRIERREEKDFVIFRSNGTPVFHFVNVVDDIAMGITHVIRGEDHISNTSKHLELFKAFGAPIPVFAHIPLILRSDGKGKMSKKSDQGVAVEYYEKHCYLSEALRNYLCLLGWSPKDNREILPIETIIEIFELSGINKNGARFDASKLDVINTEYLRQLPLEDFVKLARPLLLSAGTINEKTDEHYLREVLRISQEKVRFLEDLPEFVDYFFKDEFPYDEKTRKKLFKGGDPLARLEELRAELERTDDFGEENLMAIVQSLAEAQGRGTRDYIHVTRLAVSGKPVGPGFYALLGVLGKERVLRRMINFS